MTKLCLTLENDEKIYLDIYEEYAPLSAANFLHLVDINFYNGIIFHRIIKGFMSQTGNYTLSEDFKLSSKETGYTIPGEFAANGWKNSIRHKAGTISMARTNDMNSASSQFFICDADCDFLDDQYAAFGTVADEDSLEIVHKLSATPTTTAAEVLNDFPALADYKSVTIRSIERI